MLTLLRHGRTVANATGRLQGRTDNELDEVGHLHAKAAASVLGAVDGVVTSPLKRAQQTASYFDAPIEVDERWSELDYGDYEGKRFDEVPMEVWDRWRCDVEFRPPNGETLGELGERVRAALDDLSDRAAGHHIVVVTHVSPIKAALAWGLGVNDIIAWRCHLAAASITRIEISPIGPVVHSFNDVAHLSDADAQRRQTWAQREGLVRQTTDE